MIKNIAESILSFGMDFNVEEIHKTSIKILDEIGIYIGSNNGLNLLDSIGCRVDYKSKNVKIPESIIDKALSCNSPFRKFYDRSGNKLISIGGNNIVSCTSAAHIRVREYEGTYRKPNLDDLVNMTKIHDYFENVDIVSNIVDPVDIPLKTYRTQIAAILLKNTTKPCDFIVNNPVEAEYIYKMGCAIRGSKKNLIEKPLFSIGASSEAVLGYMDKECDLLIRCAELRIPTGGGSYPIIGLTAPLSISGALALANANFLAAHVIKTSIDPKSSTIYPVLAALFDMKSSNIVTSSPEIWLYYLMGTKLGKYYNLPIYTIVSTDSKKSDLQMAYEKAMGYFICACAGANIISSATCALDAFNLASYEQIVIDSEIISSISYYFNKFKINSSSNDFEMIKDSLNSKLYFLDSDYTLKNYKKDIWDYNVFIKDSFLNWEKIGMPSVIDNAHEKVNKILKDYKVPELPSDVLKEMDDIVAGALNRESVDSKDI